MAKLRHTRGENEEGYVLLGVHRAWLRARLQLLGNRGYGGDMAGGEEPSALTVVGVRGRKRVRGEGETTEELTWIP